jgi:hypothetical protein
VIWTWRRIAPTARSKIVHAFHVVGGEAACSRRYQLLRVGSNDEPGPKCSMCLAALRKVRDYADYAILVENGS